MYPTIDRLLLCCMFSTIVRVSALRLNDLWRGLNAKAPIYKRRKKKVSPHLNCVTFRKKEKNKNQNMEEKLHPETLQSERNCWHVLLTGFSYSCRELADLTSRQHLTRHVRVLLQAERHSFHLEKFAVCSWFIVASSSSVIIEFFDFLNTNMLICFCWCRTDCCWV